MIAGVPVDFEEKIKLPKGSGGGDYPYAIKARDLMENFVYASLDLDATLIEEQISQGGHKQRRLKIPRVPTTGTYVLGVKNNEIQWIETEDCA